MGGVETIMVGSNLTILDQIAKCKRFKYSRSIAQGPQGHIHTGAARHPSPPAQWEDDDKVGCRQRHSNGRQRHDTFNGGDGQRDGNAMATAMEGVTVMRRRRRAIEDAREMRRQWKAQQSNGGGSDGRHDNCNGCRRRDNNQLASATATQQHQRHRQWLAQRSDGDGRRCGNGHERYNNQLAKAAMDGATAMDGDGRCNRATTMAAMEDGR